MKVLINGGGNIGTTLVGLLTKYKGILEIDTIYLLKNTSFPWQEADITFLKNKGVSIINPKELKSTLPFINYVFEATDNGQGLINKELYKSFGHIKSCAQGSEKGYGKPFMSGLNDNQIVDEHFVQIVSCNTHGAASILQAISEGDFNQIKSADFVVVRRSEDLSHHKRLVTANVVARHLDDNIGTHHAIDVYDMLKTIDIDLNITSSDITTPSQLMHSTRFNIELEKPISQDDVLARFTKSSFISTTNKFDSNLVFELGRRYGFQGRIFSHAIIISNNLLIKENTIKGWAFVPQEGNSLISTLHAFMLQMEMEHINEKLSTIKKELLQKQW